MILDAIIERLDAVAIPREHEAPQVSVPERKGEHAVEAAERFDIPLGEGIQQDFGVGAGTETIALGFERRPQLTKVVDLAVIRKHEPPLSGLHRLLPGRARVDDREAPMTKPERAFDPLALPIR